MRLVAVSVIVLCCSSVVEADAAKISQLAARIDHHIDARLAAEGAEPAVVVDDRGFLRRVTLDLAGRIPTVAELDAYLQSDSPNRKEQLVQRLIDSPDFPYHQRNQLDILLLLRQEHNDSWREYLLEATRENRSWDQMFREIMLPEETLSTDLRPVAFLKRRVRDLDAMTNDSSVTWLGVNVSCAKCHDHPLVDDWTQAHYYGMASFFKRTFQTKKGFLSERFEGSMKYTDIAGQEHEAGAMFLTGTRVDAPPLQIEGDALKQLQEKIKKSEQDDKAEDPPRPDFRPRAKFVDLALNDQQGSFFARNMVNRLWARFFGRGLVHPLDQMHSQNAASHPALLDELAADFRESGYDLQRLVHAVVLTKTYARSIRIESTHEMPPTEWFAVAVPRPLSPRQLSLSLRIAGSSPQKTTGLESGGDWSSRRDELERQADGLARRLAIPDDGFQVPVTEALLFSNNPSIDGDVLNGSADRLVGYLKQIAADDQAVAAAVRSVLTREPSEEESLAMTDYLATRGDRREQGLKQIVWALITSPEFRLNH